MLNQQADKSQMSVLGGMMKGSVENVVLNIEVCSAFDKRLTNFQKPEQGRIVERSLPQLVCDIWVGARLQENFCGFSVPFNYRLQ